MCVRDEGVGDVYGGGERERSLRTRAGVAYL